MKMGIRRLSIKEPDEAFEHYMAFKETRGYEKEASKKLGKTGGAEYLISNVFEELRKTLEELGEALPEEPFGGEFYIREDESLPLICLWDNSRYFSNDSSFIMLIDCEFAEETGILDYIKFLNDKESK